MPVMLSLRLTAFLRYTKNVKRAITTMTPAETPPTMLPIGVSDADSVMPETSSVVGLLVEAMLKVLVKESMHSYNK